MTTDSAEPEELLVDHLILICKGCRGERTFYPDVPLRGAPAIIEWLRTKAARCFCGATHCDVKLHVANATAEELREAFEKSDEKKKT